MIVSALVVNMVVDCVVVETVKVVVGDFAANVVFIVVVCDIVLMLVGGVVLTLFGSSVAIILFISVALMLCIEKEDVSISKLFVDK